MKRDQIIQWAREAGFDADKIEGLEKGYGEAIDIHDLERFAASAIRALKLGQPQQPQSGDFATAVPTQASKALPADPCPMCERGGVCKTPECGRLCSSELMRLYGGVVEASSDQHGKNGPESVSESVSIPSTLSLKEADTSKRDSKESGNA